MPSHKTNYHYDNYPNPFFYYNYFYQRHIIYMNDWKNFLPQVFFTYYGNIFNLYIVTNSTVGNNLANINSVINISWYFYKTSQDDLDWYTFEKYFNFFEERYSNISLVVFTSSSDLNTNNIYDNNSEIDFFNIYSDYYFTPSCIN